MTILDDIWQKGEEIKGILNDVLGKVRIALIHDPNEGGSTTWGNISVLQNITNVRRILEDTIGPAISSLQLDTGLPNLETVLPNLQKLL